MTLELRPPARSPTRRPRSGPPTASTSCSLDGTGQTIAIVDAYDDPSIYQALDAFDTQFGLTAVRTDALRISTGRRRRS